MQNTKDVLIETFKAELEEIRAEMKKALDNNMPNAYLALARVESQLMRLLQKLVS